MACLSYKPSQVVFDQKIFERNQLIEAQGYLLFLALQNMKHLDFQVVERSLLGAFAPEEALINDQSLNNSPLNKLKLPDLGSQTDIDKQSHSVMKQQFSVDSGCSQGKFSAT